LIVNALNGVNVPLTDLSNGSLKFTDSTGKSYAATFPADGIYEIAVPQATYTRALNVPGYSSSTHSITITDPSDESNPVNKIVLAPTLSGGLRVVLRWKHIPNDLDAHVRLPDGSEVFYSNKVSPTVTLDRDGRTVADGYETCH